MGCGCNRNNRKMKSSRMPVGPRNSLKPTNVASNKKPSNATRVPIRKKRLEKLTKNDGTPQSKKAAKLKLENAIKRQKRINIKIDNNTRKLQKFWKDVGNSNQRNSK